MNRTTHKPAGFVLQRVVHRMNFPAFAVPGTVISAAAVAAFLWAGSPQGGTQASTQDSVMPAKAPDVPAAAILRGLEARVEQEQALRARMDFEQFVTQLGLDNATLSLSKRNELLGQFQHGPVAPAAAPSQPAAAPSQFAAAPSEAPEVNGKAAAAVLPRHRASQQGISRRRPPSGRGNSPGEQQVAFSTSGDDAASGQAPDPAPVVQVEAARPVPAYIGTYSTDRNGIRSFHPGQ